MALDHTYDMEGCRFTIWKCYENKKISSDCPQSNQKLFYRNVCVKVLSEYEHVVFCVYLGLSLLEGS